MATHWSMRNIAIITAVLTAIGGLIAAFDRFWPYLIWISVSSSAAIAALVTAVTVAVTIVIVRASIKASAAKLVRPDQLALRIDAEHSDHLRGREGDIESLARACVEVRQLFLSGESGTGKTALLRAGLCRVLHESNAVLPIYVGGLGREWAASEFECLFLSARSALAAIAPNSTLSITEGGSCIDPIVAAAKRAKRMALVIFDQFDDYVAFHWERFLHDGRTWCNCHELLSNNRFWLQIRDHVVKGDIRVLFVSTPEFASAFEAVRFTESSITFWLPRVHDSAIKSLLLDLSEGRDGGPPVVVHPEGGWHSLRDQLVSDLARDGLILPAQLKVALEGLRNLKALTVHEYIRIGRLKGLEATFIERIIGDAETQSGSSKGQILQLLKAVINEKDRKTEPRTFRELAAIVLGPSPDREHVRHFRVAVDSLAEPQRLLRKSSGMHGDEETYALRHDYLARGVMEVDAKTKRWAILLANSRAAFSEAPGWLSKWRALLPLPTQVAILSERLQRRIRYGEHRSYAMLSCLRLLPLLLLPLVYLQTADAGGSLPGAAELRKSLDRRGLSLWRRPPTDLEVVGVARTLHERLAEELQRRTVERWVAPAKPEVKSPHDPWTHAQASAAILHAPSLDTPSSSSVLDVLFDGACAERRVENGVDYGWVPAIRGEEPLSEPTLWAFVAVSERLALLPSGPEATDLQAKLDVLAGILPQYESAQRGWNLFARQSADSLPSTHATALALSGLITAQHAGLRLGPALANTDERIRGAVSWLVAEYKGSGASKGWAETYIDSPVCDGLTYQVLATLLRLPLDLGWRVEKLDAHLADIPEHLENLLDQDLTQHGCHGVVAARLALPDSTHLASRTQVFDFPWFPWAIELAVRYRELARQRQMASDVRLCNQVLARLVGSLGPGVAETLTRDMAGTYRISELMYALGSVVNLSAGATRPEQPQALTERWQQRRTLASTP